MKSKIGKFEIDYLWEDCTIGFKCPFCQAELVADSQNGIDICNCGKLKYYLKADLLFESI